MPLVSHAGDVLNELTTARARALEAVAREMEARAIDLCPVDTGNLRESITHAVDEDTAMVGTNVWYAPYVELGYAPDELPTELHKGERTAKSTKKRDKGAPKKGPQPFLVPAVRDNLKVYKSILKDYLS